VRGGIFAGKIGLYLFFWRKYGGQADGGGVAGAAGGLFAAEGAAAQAGLSLPLPCS